MAFSENWADIHKGDAFFDRTGALLIAQIHGDLFGLKSITWSVAEAESMNVQFRWGFRGLNILRLEVSVYNVYITNEFLTNFVQGRVKFVTRGECE